VLLKVRIEMNMIKQVLPNLYLPREIKRLRDLAYNVWWSWNPDAQELFSKIDKHLWLSLNHNPVAFLQQVGRPALNAVKNDPAYMALYEQVMQQYDEYLNPADTWYTRKYGKAAGDEIAYFSFEFGLHESLPVYAGGLGVLSGDHLKEASDMGLPLVALGFIYNEGYFSQHITEDGWQETHSLHLRFEEMPVIELVDETGSPIMVSIDLPDRQVHARIWQIQVGRIPLYLLNTNVAENTAQDRQLTARLYSHDLEVRISQEIMLGIGGVRALRRLNFNPTVWHMNEGHSGFLSLERIREMMDGGLTFEEAANEVKKTNVFTTHTPVPAGNDLFPIWLMDKYFSKIWEGLGLSRDAFMAIALHKQSWGDAFSMPVLALKLSEQRNAVSELHGHVSRDMWKFLWPEKPVEEVPIDYITNGVHTGSWMAKELRGLFNQYLGADWITRLDDPKMWQKIDEIPDLELWNVRKLLKRKLILFANSRAREQWVNCQVHPVQVIAGGVLCEPRALTIGFARRFATYKRANLILRDYERLLRIINNTDRPVQIFFSGKAHPADEPGKLLIQEVYRAVKDAKTGGRLVFLEDYDMNIARYLVQGVDVWLNTPRRPNEASGTSGMKAAINGVLNFSILDGWWYEGYNGQNGWAIGSGQEYQDPNYQDEMDAASMYDVLENEIVPLFYTNIDKDGVPVEWVARIKETIRTNGLKFSMNRMLQEYMTDMYLPAMQKTKK
jgi:starch phosphorylase